MNPKDLDPEENERQRMATLEMNQAVYPEAILLNHEDSGFELD